MTQLTTSEEAQQLSKGIHKSGPGGPFISLCPLDFFFFAGPSVSLDSLAASRVAAGRFLAAGSQQQRDRRCLGEAPGAVPNIFGSFRISFCSSPLFNPRNASANDS